MSKFFDILDNHFVNQMRMNSFVLNSDSDDERQYEDDHMTMIFTIYKVLLIPGNKATSYIRIVMRNWETKKSFSKNFPLSWFELDKPESVIKNIREGVYINSGVESRDMLNDWYELKKIELRDQKLNDLGI